MVNDWQQKERKSIVIDVAFKYGKNKFLYSSRIQNYILNINPPETNPNLVSRLLCVYGYQNAFQFVPYNPILFHPH